MIYLWHYQQNDFDSSTIEWSSVKITRYTYTECEMGHK